MITPSKLENRRNWRHESVGVIVLLSLVACGGSASPPFAADAGSEAAPTNRCDIASGLCVFGGGYDLPCLCDGQPQWVTEQGVACNEAPVPPNLVCFGLFGQLAGKEGATAP